MPRARLPRLPLPVVAGATAGLALRLMIWCTPLGRPDSDEVLSALMTRHLPAGGGLPLFVWGQHYGGTAELIPLWASLRLFGFNLVGLRVPNLVWAAVNAWLLYRLARRSVPEDAARLAGLLLWTGPAAALWFGVHEQLFYPQTMTLGLVVLVLAHRLVERASARSTGFPAEPGRAGRAGRAGRVDRAGWWEAPALGVALGVGWWTSPSILYFALPAAAALVVQARRAEVAVLGRSGVLGAVHVTAVVAGLLAGAAPWIFDAVTSDLAPLHATSTFPTIGTFPTRLGFLFSRSLAGAVGARTLLSHEWAWGVVGMIAYGAVIAVLGVGWWRGARQWSWDAIGFATFVVIYAAIPFSPDDPNLRYTFYAAPFVAMLAVRGVGRVDATRMLAALAASVLLTSAGLFRLWDLSENGGTVYRVGNVPDLGEVIAVLDREGIDRAWGDYWVAYRLVFETDERIISSPAAGIVRHEPYADAVRAADRTGWIALRGPQSAALLAALDGYGVRYAQHAAGAFVVVVPERLILPENLPEAARRAPETPRPVL